MNDPAPKAWHHAPSAGVLRDEGGRLKVQGDPTEAAMLVAAEKGGLLHADTLHASPLQLLWINLTDTPVMNQLFHSAPISGASWLRILLVAAAVFIVVELEK